MILSAIELIVPGFLWIVISGLSQRFGLIEKLCLSFLLSVCFSSVLTAALSMVTANYMLYSSLISFGCLPILLASFLIKRSSSNFNVKITRNSLPVLVSVLAYLVVLSSLYWSSPFYPSADTNDPVTHGLIAKAIIEGHGRDVLLNANYPVGLHFASTVLARIFQVNALDSIRILLSLIVLDALILTYFSSHALFESRNLANLTVLVAAFVLSVEAMHFVRIGTFANIVADAIALAVVWIMFSYIRKPSRGLGLTLSFLGVCGVFMHYGFIVFLCVVCIAAPFLSVVSRRNGSRYLFAVMYLIAGIGLISILSWQVLARNLQVAVSFLDSLPIKLTLEMLVHNFGTFVGYINLVALVLGTVLIAAKGRVSVGRTFVALWFIFMILAAFLSSIDWRFVLFSLLPGTFIIGHLMRSVEELACKISSRIPRFGKYKHLLTSLGLVLLIASGGFIGLLPKAYSPSNRTHQQGVVDSMQWLKENDIEATVASVGLRTDYRYLTVLAGISYAGDFDEPAATILSSSRRDYSYVVVAMESRHLESFCNSFHFREVYQNSVLIIFYVERS